MFKVSRYIPFALIILLIAQFCIHYNMRYGYQHIDEGVYMTMGWLMDNGKRIYVDFFEHKPPGIAAIAAILLNLSGASLETARISIALIQMMNTLLVFELARRLHDEGTGLLAAALYVPFEIASDGVWFVTEPFLVLFSTAGFLLILSYETHKNNLKLALAGTLFGVATIFKQYGILFFIAALAFTIYISRLKRESTKPIIYLPLGFFAAILPMVVYFTSNGSLSNFIFAVVTYNLLPATLSNPPQPITEYFNILFPILSAILLIPPGIYLEYTKDKKVSLLLFLWLIAGLTLFFPRPGLFKLQVLNPLLALFSANFLISLCKLPLFRFGWSVPIFIVYLLLMPANVTYECYSVPDGGLAATIDYIQNHTDPHEKIFLFPFTMQYYFYAKREPATRYLWVAQWSTEAQKDEMLTVLVANPPKYVIYDSTCVIHKCRDGSPLEYAREISDFIVANYVVEKNFTIYGGAYNAYIMVLRNESNSGS